MIPFYRWETELDPAFESEHSAPPLSSGPPLNPRGVNLSAGLPMPSVFSTPIPAGTIELETLSTDCKEPWLHMDLRKVS